MERGQWIAQSVFLSALIAIVLFGTAGRLNLPAFWLYLAQWTPDRIGGSARARSNANAAHVRYRLVSRIWRNDRLPGVARKCPNLGRWRETRKPLEYGVKFQPLSQPNAALA